MLAKAGPGFLVDFSRGAERNAVDVGRLEAGYRREKAEIRESPGLSWEQKERRIKALGDEHYARIRNMERGGAA